MNLGESFKTLLTSFGLPTIVISGVFIAINLFKVFQPITMFSSVVFEQKLFSKERMFIVRACKYMFYTFAWMVIFAALGEKLKEKFNWDYNGKLSVTAEILIAVITIIVVLLNLVKEPKRTMFKIKNNIYFKLFMVCSYVILLFIFYTEVYFLIAFSQFNDVKLLTAAVVVFFVACAAIPVVSTTVLNATVDWSTKKNVFIEDEYNKRWYILHPINKEVILLGNKSEPALCTETVIMKLEDLYKVPIKIEKTNN